MHATTLSRNSERRSTDASEVRKKIIDAISTGEEIRPAMILAILLGVLDEIKSDIAEMRKDLSDQITVILNDEQAMRDVVLNGHSETHNEDHDWLKRHRDSNCEEYCQRMRLYYDEDAKAEAQGKPDRLAVMAWARSEMVAQTNDSDSRRRIRDGWIGNVLWAGTTLLAALMLGGFVMWSSGAKIVVQ